MSGIESPPESRDWPTVEMDLTAEDEAMMLLSGFARRDPDGVLALTDKGNEWVRGWCEKQMAS